MSILAILLLIAAVLHVTRSRVSAAEIELSAGAARTDVTPDPAMVNWVDGKPYDGVLGSPRPARARSLDGDTEFALICWDLIDATEECVIDVRRSVRGATGIPETHVLVAASHTHSSPRSPFAPSTFPGRRSERLRALLDDPVFEAWSRRLPGQCAEVLKRAQNRLQPVTLNIGRANVSEWLFNRRPLDPQGNVVTMFRPGNPHALPNGLRFGSLDPTLTVLTLQGTDNTSVATVYSLPCHSVSIYPFHRGVSADWPGPANERISRVLGGETFFLQGCAGDIVPAARGEEARTKMARFFAERAIAAARNSHRLPSSPLRISSGIASLPLVSDARNHAGADVRPVEIQAVVCGPFGLAVLPGEPLNGLAREIQARSPLPHTLVIGYANGRGVSYIDFPEKKPEVGTKQARARVPKKPATLWSGRPFGFCRKRLTATRGLNDEFPRWRRSAPSSSKRRPDYRPGTEAHPHPGPMSGTCGPADRIPACSGDRCHPLPRSPALRPCVSMLRPAQDLT